MQRKASVYRNFILNDPIIDYLNVHGKFLGYKRDDDFQNFNASLLLDNYISKNKSIFIDKIHETLKGYFFNYTTDKGNVDLVMKTSDLKLFFSNHEKYVGDGYSMFTIEYANIHRNKQKRLNTSTKEQRYYAFKNWLLKKEMSMTTAMKIDYSFVLGRRYDDYPNFNLLIENTNTYDELLEEADAHFDKLSGYTIGLDLFPNMKNNSDFPWHHAKKVIAVKNKEISLIRGVSIKERNAYITSGKACYTHINHPMVENNKDFIINGDEKLQIGDNFLFIDFEILTSVYDTFSKFPKCNTDQWIFNIGCGYTKRKNFCFNSYVANTLPQEETIISQFVSFMEELPGKQVTLVHWTDIERRLFVQKIEQYSIKISKEILWLDLHKFFVNNNVLIRGCFNYKLKFVSRKLREHGLITSKWDNSFADGLGAMTGYIQYLRSKDQRIIKSIAHYNMIDCRVLWEIYELILNYQK